MPLPIITVDTLMAHPGGICAEYTRELTQSFFTSTEFTAMEILSGSIPRPDGTQVPLQDRLYQILRPEVIPAASLAEFDDWVLGQFGSLTAVTTPGLNCKSQWPQPTPFRRAVMLAELMRHELGSDAEFIAALTSFLEAI